MDQVRESRGFTNLVKELLSYKKQTESHISVLYLKDVSSMLALVSAVRESNIERHMEAERVMTNQAFALDHPNYARYGAYQQTYLQHLCNIQHPAYESLKSNGFGASI